jgi:hypothetical protein
MFNKRLTYSIVCTAAIFITGCSTTTNNINTNSNNGPKVQDQVKQEQPVQEQQEVLNTNASNVYSLQPKTEHVNLIKPYQIPKVVTKQRHISDISFTKPNQKKVVLVKKVFKEIAQCAKETVTVAQDLPFDEYYDFEVSVRKNSCCQKGGCDKKSENEQLEKMDAKVGR